jgi:hypothetical protein
LDPTAPTIVNTARYVVWFCCCCCLFDLSCFCLFVCLFVVVFFYSNRSSGFI